MAQAREPMGMEKREHIRVVSEMDDVAKAWQKKYNRPVTSDDIDTMFEEFVPLLMEILQSHSKLIPGVLEMIAALRDRGIKIGASTGYFREAAETVAKCGAEGGYIPDAATNSSDVAVGRPSPWMIYKIMETLNIYPTEAVVNVGDTPVDIETGLNAGVWSIGVAATGNETGLSADELAALKENQREILINTAREKLRRAGAHFVIDTMEELPGIIDTINAQLKRGRKP
jgi:phosphonoacetaldehyde hydrolase